MNLISSISLLGCFRGPLKLAKGQKDFIRIWCAKFFVKKYQKDLELLDRIIGHCETIVIHLANDNKKFQRQI